MTKNKKSKQKKNKFSKAFIVSGSHDPNRLRHINKELAAGNYREMTRDEALVYLKQRLAVKRAFQKAQKKPD